MTVVAGLSCPSLSVDAASYLPTFNNGEGGNALALAVKHYYPKNDDTAEVIDGTSTHSAVFESSVLPNTKYTFRFFSPAPSTGLDPLYSRFRVAGYYRRPSVGTTGTYYTRTMNSLTRVGNYLYYTFTTDSDTQYVSFFLVSAVESYDILMNTMDSLNAELYQELRISGTVEGEHIVHSNLVTFYLGAEGGIGTYYFSIYGRPSDSVDDWILLRDGLSAGEYTFDFLDYVGSYDFRVKVVDERDNVSDSYLVVTFDGGVVEISRGEFDLTSSQPDISALPDIGDSLNNSAYTSTVKTFVENLIPSSFYPFLLLGLTFIFLGWWLHK